MKYNWRFDEGVVMTFDEHVRKSVPMYDFFHNSIIELSRYYIRTNTDIIDIGTSTGSFIKALYSCNMERDNNFIGIDIEPAMINECLKRYKGDNIEFIQTDAIDVDYKNASLITLILVLQFMRKPERIKLLKKIYSEIDYGSALFIVEKVRISDIEIHDMYRDVYYDFKRQKGLSDKDIIDKNQSLRGVMFPETLNSALNILNEIGFVTEINVKYNNFVSILAVKKDCL